MAQARAEIEDRIDIRRRSLVRHFENKIAGLGEQQRNLIEQASINAISGDARKATNLKNLAAAQGVRIEKLRRTLRLRENEIEAQRVIEIDAWASLLHSEYAIPSTDPSRQCRTLCAKQIAISTFAI